VPTATATATATEWATIAAPGTTPDPAPAPSPAPVPDPAPAAVHARGLRLTGSRGPVYGPVDLDLPAGALTVVQGPQGAGRSSLLLTLAGRMVPDPGSDLTVLGEPLPRRRGAVQRRAAVAGFAGVDALDDAVTVGDVVRERLAWLSPWYRRTGRVTQATFTELAAPVFGDRPLPRVGTIIWDLDEVDAMLLRVTLALAQEPALLVVDDLDQVHDSGRRQMVWTRLEALAAAGTTVIASVASLDEVARMRWWTPPEVVNLATGPHAVPAA
jgi:ABC-type cobalamin/Fe3+-siderophores transport system ATPase subunit